MFCFTWILFNYFAFFLLNSFDPIFFNNFIRFIFFVRICLTIFLIPILVFLWNCTGTIDGNARTVSKFVHCYFPDTLRVFTILYDNYQCVITCLILWRILLLSQICIHPKYLSSYWWSYIVLHTRVNKCNEISVFRIHTYELNNNVILLFLKMCLKSFPRPYYHTHSKFIHAYLLPCHT